MIQHFFTAQSAISFPLLTYAGLGTTTASQLRKLFYHAPAQKLVAVFTTNPTDWNVLGAVSLSTRGNWRIDYLWRNGGPVEINDTPLRGLNVAGVQQTHTADTQVLMRVMDANVATDELSAIEGDAMYPLSDIWAFDIHPVRYASAAVLGEAYDASYLTTPSAGYVVAVSSTALLQVLKKPSGSAMVSVHVSTFPSWNHPRDLVYIDGSRTVMTFMQLSGAAINASAPALVRLFNTTTDPWTLLWTDTLPATDSVMCYDPTYEIVYSTGKWASNAVIHTSKLKQSPASLSTLTLVSGTTLHALGAAQISLLVTDALGSAMSGVTVCWTLSAATSGGAFVSAYTRTNSTGIATATYIGPQLSGAPITEFVSAAVATIDPVGL